MSDFRKDRLTPGSMRRVLLLLSAAVFVPVFVAQAAVYFAWYRLRCETELQTNLEVARATAATFTARMDDIMRQEGALGIAFADLADRGDDLSGVLSASVQEYLLIEYLSWLNPHGVVTGSSDPRAIGADRSDSECYRQIRSGRGWFLSDFVAGEIGATTLVVMARAIDGEDGVLRGVLEAGISAEKLAAALVAEQRPGGGRIVLYDRSGGRLYASPYTGYEPPSPAGADSMLAAAFSGVEQNGIRVSPADHARHLTAMVPVPGVGWVAVASRPRRLTVMPIVRNLAWVGALLVAVAGFSAVLGFAINRRVMDSMGMLQTHARAVGSGRLDHRIDASGIVEFDELAEAYNQMAANLAVAHARAEEGSRLLGALMDNIPEGITIADAPDVRIRLVSNYGRMLTGRSPEEIEGICADEQPAQWQIYHRDDGRLAAPEELPLTRATLHGEVVTNEEWAIVRGTDGMRIPILCNAGPIRDGDGRIIGGLLAWRDITELKAFEERLSRTAADLARSNKDLTQFAYVASHDLQEPLRMITGYLQLIERRYRGRLDDDADEFITYAVEGAARMQALINDLLSYSRLGTRARSFETVEMDDVLARVLLDLERAIEESGAVITGDYLPAVRGDKAQLARLLQNLIGNAIKFRGTAPPEIHVSALRDGDGWHFQVRDNGIGIEPQYAERVFMIFQRLHGRNSYAGTGIGLAICRRIVERHKGRIWVESAPGRGSSFHFTIGYQGDHG